MIRDSSSMFKIKYLISSFFFFLLSAPVMAAGDYGLKSTADAAEIKTSGSIAGTIGKITGALLSLVGVAFFVLMLYGGFLWMTARGDEAQSKKAQGIIVDAVIGLVIVGAAYTITAFVFKEVKP